MKYKYMGDCAAGYVEFKRPNEPAVTMPKGEAVEVPEWLAAKLATNSAFEEAKGKEKPPEKPPEKTETEDKPAREGYGECPDCDKTVRLTKDGYLYKHKNADGDDCDG